MVGKSNRHLSAHISRAVEVHQRNRYNDPAKRSTASTKSKNSIPGNETNTNYTEPYGMALSKERLYREGFDVRISNLTPQEMLARWKRVAKRHITKPSKEEFYQLMSSLPLQAHLQRVGFILSPYDHNKEPHTVSCGVIRPYEFQKDGGVLTGLFAMGDLAAILTEHLFHQGYGSIRQLCLSSKDVWQSLSSFTSTWNVLTGEFDNRGLSPVFVAYTAAYTIGQLTAPLQSGRQGLFADKGSGKNWYLKVRETERDIADEVFRLRKAAFQHMAEYDSNDWTAFGRDIKPLQIDSYDESDMLTSLKTVAKINQFASKQPWETYQMPLSLVAGRLKLLLTQIAIQTDAITVLHLHETSLVDRRVAAVLLRGCGNVTTLGIFNCPLLHFGDLIALLDLIYEVNQQRGKQAKARVESFDFFPQYYSRLPFKIGNSSDFGLTSGPLKRDIIQRGFYNILLKGFLKAMAMKLHLLFEPGQALQTFLFEVPNPPLQVSCFLDAVLRLMKVKDEMLESNEGLQALYDVLKPVRLGLDSGMGSDWPGWYKSMTSRGLWFCSSCGYSLREEFFPVAEGQTSCHRRICAGCSFQSWLDAEHYEAHQESVTALNSLFPDWERYQFNLDAPIPREIRKLVFLQSRKAIAPHTPSAILNAEGYIVANPTPPPLVRDNKIKFDSVQGLPTLGKLIGEEYEENWSDFVEECRKVDVYSRIVTAWRAEMAESGIYVDPKDLIRLNFHHFSAVPLHRDESKHPQSFNFYYAAVFQRDVVEKKNW